MRAALSLVVAAQRQFPRASGYPEDPATGVAAAALAASLQHERLPWTQQSGRFKFYQGAAMGHASLILVEDVELSVAVLDAAAAEEEEAVADPAGNVVEADADASGEEEDDDEEANDVELDDYDDPTAVKPNPVKRGKVSFTLVGRVEIDSREVIEVEADDDDNSNSKINKQ